MKKVMMLVAVLGLSTASAFAQDAPAAKPMKHSKKHKSEMKAAEAPKSDAKAAPAAAPAAKMDAKAKK